MKYTVDSLKLGEFQLTVHARERMQERVVTRQDIISVGENVTVLELQDDGCVSVTGLDEFDDALTVIAAYDKKMGTLIITVKDGT